jgi:hypothetical protein
MNAALGRAKDGKSLASAVEPIFVDLINFTSHEWAHQTADGPQILWPRLGAEGRNDSSLAYKIICLLRIWIS